MNTAIERLSAANPEWKETLTYIAQIRETTGPLPFPGFFEPLAKFKVPIQTNSEKGKDTKDKTKPDLHEVSPDLLAAWITHMAHGARVRMEKLEDAILEGLADGALYVPAILMRSHLEVAGWAAYANKLLRRFADSQNYEQLKSDIQDTAYSSALAKDDKEIVGSLAVPGVFAAPRNVMNGLDALQEFFDIAAAKGHVKIRTLYSMLCDFAHPSIAGLGSFVDVLGNESSGRSLQYVRKEQPERAHILNVLTALLWSMRGGYTSAALMQSGEIIEEEGGFRYQKPDLESGEAIRELLLQHPNP